MRYKELAEFYEAAGATTKRLEKIAILEKFLKHLPEKDKDVLYLLLGDIYPEYDERRIGISNQLAIKAIAKATGIQESQVLHEWKTIGDLGRSQRSSLKKKGNPRSTIMFSLQKKSWRT